MLPRPPSRHARGPVPPCPAPFGHLVAALFATFGQVVVVAFRSSLLWRLLVQLSTHLGYFFGVMFITCLRHYIFYDLCNPSNAKSALFTNLGSHFRIVSSDFLGYRFGTSILERFGWILSLFRDPARLCLTLPRHCKFILAGQLSTNPCSRDSRRLLFTKVAPDPATHIYMVRVPPEIPLFTCFTFLYLFATFLFLLYWLTGLSGCGGWVSWVGLARWLVCWLAGWLAGWLATGVVGWLATKSPAES